MEFTDELEYRASLAADYLASLLTLENKFVMAPLSSQKEIKYSPFVHLCATSCLYSCAKYFEKNNLKETADRGYKFISDLTFSNNKISFLTYNEKSMTDWNAMAAIVATKINDTQRGTEYIWSVIECVEEKRINPFYFPRTKEKTTTNESGICLFACLLGYERTGEIKFLNTAENIASIIIRQPLRYQQYTVLALEQLYKYRPNEQYHDYATKIVEAMLDISMGSMTSLFAGMCQEALLFSDKSSEELLQYQMSLQVDEKRDFGLDPEKFSGAFVHNAYRPEIRIDYVIHNLISFLGYFKTGRTKNIPNYELWQI